MMTRSLPYAITLMLMLRGVAADAKVIDVFPGPGTPLQDAINAANSGDTIHLNGGTYHEAIVINKHLRVKGDRTNPFGVAIDAGCLATTAIDITADRVRVEYIGAVRGGTFYGIDIENRNNVTVRGCPFIEDTCGGAEYGINVYHSDGIRLLDNQAFDFSDAGFYIGGIAAGAHVVVKRNLSSGNEHGYIVEDSLPDRIVVTRNQALSSNSSGIFLHNIDGAKVTRNIVTGKPDMTTAFGIEADATSNNNRITGNSISNNISDVVDNGSGNCWRHNEFTTGTVPPCP